MIVSLITIYSEYITKKTNMLKAVNELDQNVRNWHKQKNINEMMDGWMNGTLTVKMHEPILKMAPMILNSGKNFWTILLFDKENQNDVSTPAMVKPKLTISINVYSNAQTRAGIISAVFFYIFGKEEKQ